MQNISYHHYEPERLNTTACSVLVKISLINPFFSVPSFVAPENLHGRWDVVVHTCFYFFFEVSFSFLFVISFVFFVLVMDHNSEFSLEHDFLLFLSTFP
jgi:hypothetical protein